LPHRSSWPAWQKSVRNEFIIKQQHHHHHRPPPIKNQSNDQEKINMDWSKRNGNTGTVGSSKANVSAEEEEEEEEAKERQKEEEMIHGLNAPIQPPSGRVDGGGGGWRAASMNANCGIFLSYSFSQRDEPLVGCGHDEDPILTQRLSE